MSTENVTRLGASRAVGSMVLNLVLNDGVLPLAWPAVHATTVHERDRLQQINTELNHQVSDAANAAARREDEWRVQMDSICEQLGLMQAALGDSVTATEHNSLQEKVSSKLVPHAFLLDVPAVMWCSSLTAAVCGGRCLRLLNRSRRSRKRCKLSYPLQRSTERQPKCLLSSYVSKNRRLWSKLR